jgi:hypothetical protein
MTEGGSEAAFAWGRPDLAGRDGQINPFCLFPVKSRPALEWEGVDRALDNAIEASPLEVVVVLVAKSAAQAAQGVYVMLEPMDEVVIALGHADHSVSFTVTDSLVRDNEQVLGTLLDDAKRDLQSGDLASALMKVAKTITRLRK